MSNGSRRINPQNHLFEVGLLISRFSTCDMLCRQQITAAFGEQPTHCFFGNSR
jgi:hypothetical protein